MKKLIILLITVIYMSAATGATVHLHYCMDKLVSLGLIKNKDGKCSNCSMKESKDCCCKDEQKLLKLDTDHKASETAFHAFKLAPVIINYIPETFYPVLSSLTEEYPVSHAPPRTGSIALFIYNCVFRI